MTKACDKLEKDVRCKEASVEIVATQEVVAAEADGHRPKVELELAGGGKTSYA